MGARGANGYEILTKTEKQLPRRVVEWHEKGQVAFRTIDLQDGLLLRDS